MRRFAFGLYAVILGSVAVQCWLIANRPEPPRPAPIRVAVAEVVRAEPVENIGPSLHEFGRPCLFDSNQHRLGDTPYTASIGPNYYEDVPERTPAFYRIQVCFEPTVAQPPDEPPRPPEVIPILFQRDFRLDELPDDILARSPAEVVSFDPSESIVTFHLGEKQVTFKLP